MIREARRSDIPDLVRMARDFHNASPMARLPFARESAAEAAMRAIDASATLALVVDLDGLHGALLGSVRAYPLGPVMTAHEDVLWVDPEYRGKWGIRLIRAFEGWARSKGAAVIGLSCPMGTVESLYMRLGYDPAETTFSMGL